MNGRVEDLAEPDGSFDLVLVNRALHCHFDPLGVLLAAHRLLRAGGVLVVQVPNRDGLATTLADRSVQWGSWFLFSPVVLHRALEAIGFETQRVLAIQTQPDASVRDLGVDLSPWRDDLVVQLLDRDAVLAQIESRRPCADFFSLAARRAPDGPGSMESRARLASVSAHSRRPRRGVAIDPDSKVRWPWDTGAAVGAATELRDAAASGR